MQFLAMLYDQLHIQFAVFLTGQIKTANGKKLLKYFFTLDQKMRSVIIAFQRPEVAEENLSRFQKTLQGARPPRQILQPFHIA